MYHRMREACPPVYKDRGHRRWRGHRGLFIMTDTIHTGMPAALVMGATVDSTIASAVVGALAVVVGTLLAHWLDRKPSTAERRSEVRRQLLLDLRQALVAALNKT